MDGWQYTQEQQKEFDKLKVAKEKYAKEVVDTIISSIPKEHWQIAIVEARNIDYNVLKEMSKK